MLKEKALKSVRKKDVPKTLAKFTGKHLCWSLFFFKKKTPTEVFSSEFSSIFKNIFFTEHLHASASVSLVFFRVNGRFLSFLERFCP